MGFIILWDLHCIYSMGVDCVLEKRFALNAKNILEPRNRGAADSRHRVLFPLP